MSTLSTFIKRLRDIMRNDAGVNGDAQRIEQIAWMLFLKVYDSKEEDWALDEDDYQSILPDDCRWCNWAHDDGSGRVPTGDTLLDFVNNRLFPALKTLPVSADMPVKKSVVQSVFQDTDGSARSLLKRVKLLNSLTANQLVSFVLKALVL